MTSAEERERLKEIARLQPFGEEIEELLGDLVQRATTELGLPVGLITVVLDRAQYFAASEGLGGWMAEAQATPREWAFCQKVVEREAPFVVEDALIHEDVRVNPLVLDEGVRCYAGVPLCTPGGHIIGSVCVLGHENQTFGEADLGVLTRLSEEAMRRLEARAARLNAAGAEADA